MPRTPTRNQLCPCGNGLKYKHCHGRIDVPAFMQEKNAHEIERLAVHGDVREVATATNGTRRLILVGGKSYWSDDPNTNFPQFLGFYLDELLGFEWYKVEAKKQFCDQHPIVQWRTLMNQEVKARSSSAKILAATGAANAWVRLAYDMFLIANNAQLQKKLVKRLRDPIPFQGARFEAAIAAMMLTAGYDLEFANEKAPGKHPEFYATHKITGQRLAVEAKSKYRDGVLGHKETGIVKIPDAGDIARHLKRALLKNPLEPLLVFVELNLPLLGSASTFDEFNSKLSGAWKNAQSQEWPEGFPAIGVVFYNDAAPWLLETNLFAEPPVTIFTIKADRSRHSFDPDQLLEGITSGCAKRLNIPSDFSQIDRG